MTSGIYHITNTRNNRMYIGKSSDIECRFLSHQQALRGNRHINKALQSDWNEHGATAFQFSILIEVGHSIHQRPGLCEIERKFIKAYSTNQSEFGYNADHSAIVLRALARKTNSIISRLSWLELSSD